MKKVVLAFSGGLDTSFCCIYLSKDLGMEVHSVVVNTGGFSAEEIKNIEARAYELGVKSHTTIDETEDYYRDTIKYLIFGNVLKNATYPLSVSAERVCQATAIANYAKKIGAACVAHGSNLYFILAYEYGAKIYNSTLAQKVEGSDPRNNADRRVLYERWKKPGDVALYKRIDDTTPPYQTTRLVQNNDFLRLQTLTLSYDLPRNTLEKLRLERARVMVTSNDLFRFSTVKMERGTVYPYAQTFSLALNLTF